MEPAAVILQRVDTSDDCWMWEGPIDRHGYGRLSWRWAKDQGVSTLVHRALYQLLIGVPDGLEMDHLCHNISDCNSHTECLHRRCVNPEHLEPVTHRTNMLRGRGVASTNIEKTHCPQGHPYTDENTYTYDGPGNRRRCCRACNREQKHKTRRKSA